MKWSKTLVTLGIPAVAASSAIAHAEPGQAQPTAETLYAEGQAAYDKADYSSAIAKWEESYKLSGASLLLFNLAQARRLAGDCPHALSTYTTFIQVDPTADQVALARDWASKLTAQCGQPAARLRDDGAEHPTGMFTMRRKIAIGAATVSATSLVTAIVLGTTANNKKNDAFTLCPEPQTPCADAGSAHDLTVSGHHLAIGADVMFGVAGAAAITAGVLWFTGASESPRRLTVLPTAHGVVMLGRF